MKHLLFYVFVLNVNSTLWAQSGPQFVVLLGGAHDLRGCELWCLPEDSSSQTWLF